jgi:hypothetical protein
MYNIFKRPMFKRGGTAQGSGIMSTVEPRQQYQEAGPVYPFEKRSAEELLNFTPIGRVGAGLNILRQAGRFATKPDFYTGPSGQAGRTLEKAPFLSNQYFREAVRPYVSGGIETLKRAGTGVSDFAKKYGVATGLGGAGVGTIYGALDQEGTPPIEEAPFLGADDTSEAATILPGETAMDAVFKRAEEKVKERKTKETKTDPGIKITPEPEETFDSVYQKEFDKLEKVVGKDDDTKGLLALAIGEALSTPGTIADKSKILNKYLFKIAGERKSDRREIAKLAYSATKQIEAAKIAAGKEGYSEKLANEIRQYQGTINNPNASQQAKDFARQQIGIIGNTMKVLNPPKEGLTSVESNMLTNFGKTVDKLAKVQDKNSDAYRNKLNDYLTQRKTLLTFLPSAAGVIAEQDKRLGLANGGRVGFAEGSSPMQQVIPEKTIQTVGQGQTPTAEVDSLSFEQIRSRLPEEITDDVVTLLASSNAALQDFSYIRTQGDVNKFNQKYGVSLVLPATA